LAADFASVPTLARSMNIKLNARIAPDAPNTAPLAERASGLRNGLPAL
jgi:hypothetical protein